MVRHRFATQNTSPKAHAIVKVGVFGKMKKGDTVSKKKDVVYTRRKAIVTTQMGVHGILRSRNAINRKLPVVRIPQKARRFIAGS